MIDPAMMTFIGGAIQIIKQYGVPAAKRIIEELARKDDPTLEEIEALDDMMKDPEAYFEG
jgi:hypothetical protein